MTPDCVALHARLDAFDIDGPEPVALPFAARLAREHGWSRTYADRVVGEYKRYVFLAATGDDPVCPAEDVDAAWHLHLTYTRSYWKRLCGDTLGRQLHHDPTRGGPAEADKHLAMYARTLARYLTAFGHDAPADIWPPAATRFGDDLKHRVVNIARNWVVPKLPVKRVAQFAAAFALLAVFLPGCAGGGMNPFNLVGREFLGFLIPMMVAAVCVARVVRSARRTPGPQPGDDDLPLTWEQAAYLAGGYPRLTSAAVARLAEVGAARVTDEKSRLGVGDRLPDSVSPVEEAVFNLLPFRNTAEELKPVQDAVEAKFAPEAARLEADGFTIGTGRQAGIGCAALVPIALVMFGLAVPRLVMGLADHKPVEYLVVAMIFGGFFGLILSVAGSLRLSRRGEAALARLRAQHAGFRTGAVTDAALSVALFGTAVLAGSTVAFLQPWYPRQTTEGSSGGCGSGCGSDGDGGGGGGCGGGCGGCGGGGD